MLYLSQTPSLSSIATIPRLNNRTFRPRTIATLQTIIIAARLGKQNLLSLSPIATSSRLYAFSSPVLPMSLSLSSLPDGKEGIDRQIKQQKKNLRRMLRLRLENTPQDDIQRQSRLVWDNLFALPQYHDARSVGLFLSMPRGEIITDQALARVLSDGKTLYVPRVGLDFEKCEMDLIKVEDRRSPNDAQDPKPFYHDWPQNKWSIPEPPSDVNRCVAQRGDIDLLVVPGLAFDAAGGRLGQGKGYYDRFISKMREDDGGSGSPLLVAVGLEQSFFEGDTPQIPMSDKDLPMDIVVLPNRSLHVESSR